jgi:hypothetical protein
MFQNFEKFTLLKQSETTTSGTTMQQQIARQIREGKKPNPIDDIFGKWPGNESDEEFEQMLNSLKTNETTTSDSTGNNTVLPEVPLSDTELIAKCGEWVSKLCRSGGRAWTLRVPVDFTRDPDVLFTELIKRFEAGGSGRVHHREGRVSRALYIT